MNKDDIRSPYSIIGLRDALSLDAFLIMVNISYQESPLNTLSKSCFY